MTTPPMPKAKTERLIVREIDGETLVDDRSRDAASCLNVFRQGLARVRRRDLRRRDRRRAGRGRTRRLAGAASTDESELLTEAITFPPDMSAAKSRREIGARLGLGAAAVVASIVAPVPAQAASCLSCGEFCSPIFGRGPCCFGLMCMPTPTLGGFHCYPPF